MSFRTFGIEACRAMRAPGLAVVLGACVVAPAIAMPLFGTNLIVNGGAESGAASATGFTVVAVPGWTTTGNFTVVAYDTSGGFPLSGDPGPTNRGSNFFAGGPNNAFSSATQTIDVSGAASSIDAGTVTFTYDGWLGGFATQRDGATAKSVFIGSGPGDLGSVSIGPVTNVERSNVTGLLFRTTSGAVPVGTRAIRVSLDMQRFDGSYNDGYADNLSLVLADGQVSGAPEPATLALLALGLAGLGFRRRRH